MALFILQNKQNLGELSGSTKRWMQFQIFRSYRIGQLIIDSAGDFHAAKILQVAQAQPGK